MSGHICVSVKKNCWNLYDSYGEICVGCGCCSHDKLVRYHSRLDCLKRWLEEKKNFHWWADNEEVRKIQEENMKADIENFTKQIAEYEKKLMELGSEE